jgi:hypothetical protein
MECVTSLCISFHDPFATRCGGGCFVLQYVTCLKRGGCGYYCLFLWNSRQCCDRRARMRAQLSRSGRLVCWLVGGWFLARHTLISMVAECGVCVYVSCQKQRSVWEIVKRGIVAEPIKSCAYYLLVMRLVLLVRWCLLPIIINCHASLRRSRGQKEKRENRFVEE